MQELQDIKYSVVMTVFNDEKEIIGLLENILKQTVVPSEIVIADGGSKDGTIKLIEEFVSDIEIRLFKGSRLNISEGLNLAIKEAKYEFIGIAMTGNRYESDFFEKLLETLLEQGGQIAYGLIKGECSTRFSKLYNQAFLNGNIGINIGMPSNHGVIINKEVFDKIGYFYEKFIYAGEDEEFYTRASKKNISCIYVDKAILYWDTPHDLKQYLKQKKVYTIASMQIYTLSEIMNRQKGAIAFYTITLMLIILLWMWFSVLAFLVVPVELFCIYLFFKVLKKYSMNRVGLYLLEVLSPLVYMCTNVKYFKKIYKVNLP